MLYALEKVRKPKTVKIIDEKCTKLKKARGHNYNKPKHPKLKW